MCPCSAASIMNIDRATSACLPARQHADLRSTGHRNHRIAGTRSASVGGAQLIAERMTDGIGRAEGPLLILCPPYLLPKKLHQWKGPDVDLRGEDPRAA